MIELIEKILQKLHTRGDCIEKKMSEVSLKILIVSYYESLLLKICLLIFFHDK